MLAVFEGCEDIGVHVDGEVLLRNDLLVTSLDGSVDPVPEGFTHDGVDHICQVGPGQLFNFTGFNW